MRPHGVRRKLKGGYHDVLVIFPGFYLLLCGASSVQASSRLEVAVMQAWATSYSLDVYSNTSVANK